MTSQASGNLAEEQQVVLLEHRKHACAMSVVDDRGLATGNGRWQDSFELVAGPSGRGGTGTRMGVTNYENDDPVN